MEPRLRQGLVYEPSSPEDDGVVYAEATQQLLRWYEEHARELPWRKTRDPYRILIAEVMLQQTRVAVVEDRYERFLRRFPRVEDLAAASENDVLAEWSGLGYYSRARNLHRAARQIGSTERFPDNRRELSQLPGVGEYTASAIAAFAFDEYTLALDGNVERVLGRVLMEEGNPKLRATRKRLVEGGLGLVHRQRAADSNQALIELGATVCTPRDPHCSSCPLRRGCRALQANRVDAYGKKAPKKATQEFEWKQLVCIDDESRILMHRRSKTADFLAGTWELPGSLSGPGVATPAAARGSNGESEKELELQHALARQYGGRWLVDRGVGDFRHHITYRRIRVRLFTGSLEVHGRSPGSRFGWFTRRQIEELHTSSMVTKTLDCLRHHGVW